MASVTLTPFQTYNFTNAEGAGPHTVTMPNGEDTQEVATGRYGSDRDPTGFRNLSSGPLTYTVNPSAGQGFWNCGTQVVDGSLPITLQVGHACHLCYHNTYNWLPHVGYTDYLGVHVPGRTYQPGQAVMQYGQLLRARVPTSQFPDHTLADYNLEAFIHNFAHIGGAPANFSPGAGFTAIQNWGKSMAVGEFAIPSASTGVVTLPRAAEYRVNAQVIFQQGNSNKELACLLWVRSSVAGDFVLDSIQISDDKTNWRAVCGAFGYEGAAGETLQLGLSRVNQSMGSCSFQPCTFYVNMTIPAGFSGSV